jgi:pimeloyl-ACP methyl ester carboxylesterase
VPFIELSDGVKRYYETWGPEDGPVIFLLHGWCASSRLFSEQAPVLASAGYRVVASDAPGHGRSEKGRPSVTPDRLEDDFHEMAEALGYWKKPFAIIGHSAGGGVAQYVCFRWPEKVKALVLLNTGYRMRDSLARNIVWTPAPHYMRVFFSEPVKRVVRPLAKEAFAAIARITGKDEETARLWVDDIFATPAELASAEVEELMKHDSESRLRDIRVPVCILGGTLDLLAPPRQSKRMHELIPGSELHMLQGTHTMKMWQSKEVNDIILSFLARAYPVPPKAAPRIAEKVRAKEPPQTAPTKHRKVRRSAN